MTYSPVGLFFTASFIVLWAALMQLSLVRVLISELRLDKTVTDELESWTSGTVGAIASILVVYATVSLVKTVGKQHRLKVGGKPTSAEPPSAHWNLL